MSYAFPYLFHSILTRAPHRRLPVSSCSDARQAGRAGPTGTLCYRLAPVSVTVVAPASEVNGKNLTERDLSHLPEGVRAAVGMLRDAWHDVLMLKGSRLEWEELRPSLREYGNLAALLGDWYRAYTLAGARRLLDDTRGVSSPIRAMRLVSRHAEKVTLDVLAAGFAGSRYEAEHRRHLEERLVELAGVPALTPAAVNKAIDDLRRKHDAVTQLAHDSVAHRALRPGDTGVPVTYEDISNLLSDVGDIIQTWMTLLDNVSLSLEPPRIGHTNAAATALRLFDWRAWIKARSQAEWRVGPSAPPEIYDRIAASGRLEYVFDVPDQTWPPTWNAPPLEDE